MAARRELVVLFNGNTCRILIDPSSEHSITEQLDGMLRNKIEQRHCLCRIGDPVVGGPRCLRFCSDDLIGYYIQDEPPPDEFQKTALAVQKNMLREMESGNEWRGE